MKQKMITSVDPELSSFHIHYMSFAINLSCLIKRRVIISVSLASLLFNLLKMTAKITLSRLMILD